jgi:PASTA domain
MSDPIETQLRALLGSPPPPAPERTVAARTAALDALPRRRGWVRRALTVGVPATGFAGLALVLILAAPRGTKADTATTTGPVPFAILNHGSAPDLSALGIRPNALGFPRVDPTSLRRVGPARRKALPTLVGRTTDGLICVVQVYQQRGVPTTVCAAPDDVTRSALFAGPRRDGRRVAIVADGVRLAAGTAVVALHPNAFELAKGTTQVSASFPDGTQRTLRVRDIGRPSLSLSDADAQRPAPVPDLAGLSTWSATQVLYGWRLADGRRVTQATDAAPPGTVIGQDPPPGATAPGNSEVRLVVATPTGPNGQRTVIDLDASLEWRSGFNGDFFRGYRRDPLRSLAGQVTTLVFIGDRPEPKTNRYFAGGRALVVRTRTRRAAEADRPRFSSFGVVADPSARLATALGVTRYPTTVVLDNQARVAIRSPGANLARKTHPTRPRASGTSPDERRSPPIRCPLPFNTASVAARSFRRACGASAPHPMGGRPTSRSPPTSAPSPQRQPLLMATLVVPSPPTATSLEQVEASVLFPLRFSAEGS